MEIIRHPDTEKDFRSLKRFPAPVDSLGSWERLFCLKGMHETPGIKQYPGFGSAKIYKARVVPLKENCGKSDGYRVVFQICEDGKYKIILFSRHGVYRTEQELINIIKSRI